LLPMLQDPVPQMTTPTTPPPPALKPHPLSKPDKADLDLTRCTLCRKSLWVEPVEWLECDGPGCDAFLHTLTTGRHKGELAWHSDLLCVELGKPCGVCYQKRYGLQEAKVSAAESKRQHTTEGHGPDDVTSGPSPQQTLL